VRFLIGHDLSMVPLARSRNNNENSTMQMSVTDRGMEIRVDLDTENNADSKKLYSAVQRGDISGMSFTFVVDSDAWDDIDSDHPTRTIRSIKRVYEVSAVAFPAYPQTSLEARSSDAALDSARASLDSAKEQRARELAIEKLTHWRHKK
jgi:HK97 family phage prohead protease